jgi:hypothetical protein
VVDAVETSEQFVNLNAAIDAYAEQAIGSDTEGGEVGRQRALALDAFQGKIIDEAPEGRSEVSTWSVFETIQWILPSLTRIFAAGDDIVEFDPVGPEDEDAAAQESEVLNHLVTRKNNNNWFLTCLSWFQDALLTKNAYCMVFMEEKLDTEVERYENQTEEQVALILDDDVEVVGQEQFDDPGDEGAVVDPFTGQPVQDEITLAGALQVYEELGQEPLIQRRQLFNIEIRKTKAKKKLQFQVLPPERVLVGEDTPDFTLDKCNYFEYFERETISDLRKMGFDVPDDIGDQDFAERQEDESRDELLEHDLEVDSPDPSMKQVNVRNIWIRYDMDGDGIAELQHVVRVGNDILSLNPVSNIPVASIVPFLNTHRHIGMSVADLVFDLQRISTAILRSGMDSLNLALRPRHAASRKVNLDDLLQQYPGSVVQIDTDMPDVAGHVQVLQTENTFPFAIQGLDQVERIIESRVGVNRQFQGIDEGLSNEHDRIGQLSTMAAQRVEQIARIFGNGVERLFNLAHEVVIKSGHQMDAIKLRGQWVNVDPTQWRTGRDMRVVAPFAAGNKDSLLRRLMIIAGFHEKALAGGLPIVDPSDAYELALELSAAADLPGHKFFTDPATIPPPEPQPDPTMIALEIENKKADNEATDEQRKDETERLKVAADIELKERLARLQSATQIVLAQIQDDPSADLQQVDQVMSAVDAVSQQVDDVIAAQSEQKDDKKRETKQNADKALNATLRELSKAVKKLGGPRKVVRENGQIVGVE